MNATKPKQQMRHWQIEISEYIHGSNKPSADPFLLLAIDRPDAEVIKKVFGIVGSVHVHVREFKPMRELGGHQILSLDTFNGYGVHFDILT